MDLEPYKNCFAFKNAIHITNDTSAPYRPCCWYKNSVNADSWQDYQEKINQQDIETNCKHCIDQDAANITSMRHTFFCNELVIGAFFDNVCNLKCVTCGPSNSTQWIKDYKIYRPKHNIKNLVNLQTYTPSKIDFIKTILNGTEFNNLRFELYGGEPLIGVSCIEFLDWLYEQPYADRTTIIISTNGTTYLSKFEKYLNKFKCRIIFSIDGIGHEFEYLRTNAVFTQVQSVIDSYRTNLLLKFNEKVSLSFNYTLSWMNSLHFADFYNWATDRYPEFGIGISVVKGPFGFSINALTPSTRKKICDLAIGRMTYDTDSKNLYQSVMLAKCPWEGPQVLQLGMQELAKLDNIRSRDYKKTFKEVISLLDNDL
jgi:organic radical activating enzyme